MESKKYNKLVNITILYITFCLNKWCDFSLLVGSWNKYITTHHHHHLVLHLLFNICLQGDRTTFLFLLPIWLPVGWSRIFHGHRQFNLANTGSVQQRLSWWSFFFFFNFYLFIYFIFGCAGLHFCARAFSSCGERGPLFIAVRGPLTVAASLVAEHKLQMRRLSSCGSRA